MLQPQEIEVLHILPYIRAQVAEKLKKKHGFKNFQVAIIMGLTEAAISQYAKGKRGKKKPHEVLIEYDKGIALIAATVAEIPQIREIKRADNLPPVEEASQQAKQIVFKETYLLLELIRKHKDLCTIHRSLCDCIPEDCKICLNAQDQQRNGS